MGARNQKKKEVVWKLNHLLYYSFGTFVNLEVAFWLHKLDNNVGVLEVNNRGLPILESVLVLITSIDDTKVMVNDLLMSGTRKKLDRKSQTIETWTAKKKSLKKAIKSVNGVTGEKTGEKTELFPVLERMKENVSYA